MGKIWVRKGPILKMMICELFCFERMILFCARKSAYYIPLAHLMLKSHIPDRKHLVLCLELSS